MNKGYIFPLVLITLDLCAGVVYLANGDVRKFVYWIAAAVLNIAVTFQEAIYMFGVIFKVIMFIAFSFIFWFDGVLLYANIKKKQTFESVMYLFNMVFAVVFAVII